MPEFLVKFSDGSYRTIEARKPSEVFKKCKGVIVKSILILERREVR